MLHNVGDPGILSALLDEENFRCQSRKRNVNSDPNCDFTDIGRLSYNKSNKNNHSRQGESDHMTAGSSLCHKAQGDFAEVNDANKAS